MIDSQCCRITLILNPAFDGNLTDLAKKSHVWIIATPHNRAIADEFWQQIQGPRGDMDHGVSTFEMSGSDHSSESLFSALELIEMHLDSRSARVSVVGIEVSPNLLARLGDANYDFVYTSKSSLTILIE